MSKRRFSPSRASAALAEPLENRVLLSASPVVAGYLPDYEYGHFSEIDLNALTNINYFSIALSSTGSLPAKSTSGYDFSQLQTVVADAHAASPRVSVSITVDNATPFLTIAASPNATANFVSNLISFCSTYHLDGIDLDFEPSYTLTTAQKNSYGDLLAALHAQTSAKGLLLSAAVQVSQMVVPQADIGDLDRYYVMDYDLDYDSSAPYSESISYLTGWANYGVPKSELIMGVPFYGRSGTSWSNTTTDTYSLIMSTYATFNGGAFPSPSADSATINGTTWGYNGVDTIEQKAQYVLQNGYGGMMIWELGQDYFNSSGAYTSVSLLPAIKSVFGAADETWIGRVSSDWNTADNWSFGQVPGSATDVVINSGSVTVGSAFNVDSLTLNGGTLTLSAGGADFTTSSLTINPGATLDLKNNALFINYGANPSPISIVQSDLSSGYANGAWNGTGIISSTAAANPAYGLGYADGADGMISGLGSGQFEIVYTLVGDTSLDGTVNSIDFGTLAANFGQSGKTWDQGDFDYNQTVNSVDFGLLAGNFGKSTTLPAVEVPASDVVVLSTTALATPTPVASANMTSDRDNRFAAPPMNDSGPQSLDSRRHPNVHRLLR
jgi:Glycosyl hydrolases family 18